MTSPEPSGHVTAADVTLLLDALVDRGASVAVAESLTGGMVLARLTDVPGSSRVVRGGVVAYATDAKTTLAGVDPDLLARVGPVHPDVARALAEGARARLAATYGLGTTGVAGPDGQDGHPPGEVHVCVAGPDGVVVRSLALPGDRAAVRDAAVTAVLRLLGAVVGPRPPG